MTCTCSHNLSSHGLRASRSRPHRDVARGCLVEDCACEEFTEARPVNRATMPPEFHRALSNLRREFNDKLDALRREYELKR